MGDELNSKNRKNKSKYLGMEEVKSSRPGSSIIEPIKPLRSKQRGFLITCNYSCNRALMESYNILDTIIEQRNEPTTSGDADDDLKQEFEVLESGRPFKQVMTYCKNGK